MFGHLVRHHEVGLGLLLVMVTPAATGYDIALVPLMRADGVGISLVFVFAEL